MTSPSPARSKTTPSSMKLSAGRIVKKYQRLRKTDYCTFFFFFFFYNNSAKCMDTLVAYYANLMCALYILLTIASTN